MRGEESKRKKEIGTHIANHPRAATQGLCRAYGLQIRFRSGALPHQNKKDTPGECPFVLEVQAGFEPADNGVADRGLTTWLLYHTFGYLSIITKIFCFVKGIKSILSKEFLKFFVIRGIYEK